MYEKGLNNSSTYGSVEDCGSLVDPCPVPSCQAWSVG